MHRAFCILLFGVCLLAVLAAALAAQETTQQTTAPAFPASKIHEELIAEASPGSEVGAARATENHVAWIEKGNGKKTVRNDGKPVGGAYDDVKYLNFSRDQQHLAFIEKRKSNWALVVDGEERSPEYGKMTAPSLSANGRFFAVGACHGKKCRLVVNGEEMGPEFEDISTPGFSAEGEHYAYFGKRAKKWMMLLDGKELGPEIDDFDEWRFGPEGKRIAVAALTKGKWTWIVDGTPGPAFDVISRIAFSHDGKHYAYGGTDAKWGFSKNKTHGAMVVDSQVTGTYVGSGFGGAWQGLFGQSAQIVTGLMNLSANFHGVSDPLFASDGALIYAARHSEGDVSVLVNGVAGPSFEDIVSPIGVTPDAKHIAYVGKQGESFLEVRDHKPGASFPGKRTVSYVELMIMSRDGSHLAYEIVRGGQQFKAGTTRRALRRMVIDGQAGPEYDAFSLGNFEFSADGRHYYCEVHRAQGDRDRVIFDGLEGKLYDDVFLNSVKFVDEQTIEFVAQDGRRFLRVTETFE